MRYYLDTEFIEYPCTIQLISIGIMSQDNRLLYAVNRECDTSKASQWVIDNILSTVKIEKGLTRKQIGETVLRFIGDDLTPEFWGYHCAYDWVAFTWLFGPLVDIPKPLPKRCYDLKQLLDQHRLRVPFKSEDKHNALSDAQWNKRAHEWVMEQIPHTLRTK